MSKVIQLPTALVMAEADYQRHQLQWVKRRARRLQHFFKVSRRTALVEATNDYFTFTGMHRERVLKLIQGGQHV